MASRIDGDHVRAGGILIVIIKRSCFSLSSACIALGILSGAAQAADAETAAACSKAGPNAFYVAGAATCVDPGGYLWAEGYYNTYTDYPSKNAKTYGIATIAVTLDTVSDTGWLGDFKTFFDVRLQLRSAEPFSGSDTVLEYNPQSIYFEWAGFTVGYRTSLFDFYANNNIEGTDPETIGDDTNLLLAAYTLSLPQGFGLTLSVEDSHDRKAGVDASNATSSDQFGQNLKMPDFVGVLSQSGSWGGAQLSGALHRIKANTPSGFQGDRDPDAWGYAVQAGVMFNLPFLSEGDTLYLQSAYVDGATTYLGLQNPSGDFSAPDAYITAGGGLSKVTGWNVTAQYLHNWTPQLNSAFFGGYGQFDVPTREARKTYGASGAENINLGVNLVWSPTDTISLVAQYNYNRYLAKNWQNTGEGLPRASQDAHGVLLMTQYNF